MLQSSENTVQTMTIDANEKGQRLDNYLIKHLKGVPKGHIYRIVRKGEVRVNKKRCKVSQRLDVGDIVRIPPIRLSQRERLTPSLQTQEKLLKSILFEDEHLLILNKPAGWPVHGGSGSDYGIIETLKLAKAHTPYIELVHRLDKDTSGCLMIAKSRKSLLNLQEMLSSHDDRIVKTYTALVRGQWRHGRLTVEAGLSLDKDQNNTKLAQIDEAGKAAVTMFSVSKVFNHLSLLKVKISTGRMHQIRAHAAHIDHPLAGDNKYGDFEFNRQLKKQFGLNRIFLHASKLQLRHPITNQKLDFNSPLSKDLRRVLSQVEDETV